MKLHLANTDDGHTLWRALLTGSHNDGDGGLDVRLEWFTVACSEQQARSILGPLVEAQSRQFRWYQAPHTTYQTVSAMNMVVCARGANGHLTPVELVPGSPVGIGITAALMDTRG
jgi:hypothetical protein